MTARKNFLLKAILRVSRATYAANPVSQFTQYAIVGDLCPECGTGALDQATYGDGRWTISWNPVQCNVGNSSFVYSFQGSNPYYLKMQVANTR